MKLVIFAGNAWHSWNPETAVKMGDGGANMALVDLPPRLAERGWDVTVYAHCEGEHAGTFDGVTWKHFQDGFEGDSSDLLIVWRKPGFIRSGHQARRTLFMARDMHYHRALQPRDAKFVDCFAVLSQWHHDYWLQRHPWCMGKMWVTRNGVDLSRFTDSPKPERQRFRAAYTSAPYRGLDVALRAWPFVRKTYPEAELHVFYGFESSIRMAESRGDKQLHASLTALSELVERTEGVVNHGRTGRAGIDSALLSSHVWVYPSTFLETSCAAAMEAQVAGCHVVTNDLAALKETARFGVQLEHDQAKVRDYGDAIKACFARDPVDADTVALAREAFDIETLADEWDEKLRELVA